MEKMIDSLFSNIKYDANTMQICRTWLGTCPTNQHIREQLKITIINSKKPPSPPYTGIFGYIYIYIHEVYIMNKSVAINGGATDLSGPLMDMTNLSRTAGFLFIFLA